jgi:prolipoprotein diacylglyceryltransferase
VEFEKPEDYLKGREAAISAVTEIKFDIADSLDDTIRHWQHGKNKLALSVQREGNGAIDLPPFTPRTVGVYPTQLYEIISMILLMLVLLAYYPYRRHDGELMVLLMVGYSIHRFINESLRIEPTYALGLSLSQWISVGMLVAAIGMEIYLWRVMPSRWKPAVSQEISTPPPGATQTVASK